MNRVKKYFMLFSAALLVSGFFVSVSVAQTLTASTSLTVVNVTEFPFNSVDITKWPGAWPNDPADLINPQSQEVYLYNVHFTSHHMSWSTVPSVTPYPAFPNTVNSMVAAVWSVDGGKTFKLGSWDYLNGRTSGKGIEAGMPNCWMGTLVHSICDRKAGECNGRNRSNLYFTEFPTGNTNCWGTL